MGKNAVVFALLIGSVMPAWANWNEIGHITVHDQGERFMRDLPVTGPIEKLRFYAVGGDIFCRSVQATLAEGVTQDLFQGLLPNNHPFEIDLPSKERNIQMLTFQCGALVYGEASIRVFIDRGRDHGAPAV